MFTENEQLKELIDRKTEVTIFLVNGFQLHGTIAGNDHNVIWLYSGGRKQMIYKHAISTVDPSVGR